MNEPSAEPVPPRPRRSRNKILAVGAAIPVFLAAATLAVYLFQPKEPSWKLLQASGTPDVLLDGAAVPLESIKTIRPRSHLRVGPGGTIEVGIPHAVPITLEAGAEATLGSSKGGLDGDLPSVTLHAGSLHSGAASGAVGLWIETYTASILFQGTPFAATLRGETLEVVVDSAGADVLAKKTGEMTHVPAGSRLIMAGVNATPIVLPVGADVPDTSGIDSLGARPGGLLRNDAPAEPISP